MVPRGLVPLVAFRKRGLKPAGAVWLTLGDGHAVEWWRYSDVAPQASVPCASPIGRLDLRCLVGLRVVVEGHGEALMRLAERVREFASEVVVHQFERAESDFGMYWRKGMDQWVPLRSALAGEVSNG